ncbi:hypothetical protein CF8_2364 [Nocardioides sp. CF8]|nr:hypothetical protein CF8_2364 [Nocardioides sp. CF8]
MAERPSGGCRRTSRSSYELGLEVDPAADHRADVRTELGWAHPGDPLLRPLQRRLFVLEGRIAMACELAGSWVDRAGRLLR